ncbi:MAG: Imm1 family immunity protein [Stackebrandtia sp.]
MTTVRMWYEPGHGDQGLTATTEDELRAALDAFITDEHYLSIMQMVITDSDGHDVLMELAAASKDEQGALRYSSSAHVWFSQGEPTDYEVMEFAYYRTPHSFPTDSLIPIEEVRQAAAEFLTSGGQRPTCVRWQADADSEG